MSQLPVNGFVISQRILRIDERSVDKMNQNPGSLNMAKKARAEAAYGEDGFAFYVTVGSAWPTF